MGQHPWLEHKNWAVIGASQKEESYGYRITKRLLEEGYKAIPITPKYETVCGVACYPHIEDYEGVIDVVDVVVNPTIGINLLEPLSKKGINKVLLQPGTSSPQLVKKAQELGMEVLESCVLVLLAWK